MVTLHQNETLNHWHSINAMQTNLNQELERALQENYRLSLNEFYVLYFLSQAPQKKLRLQQLQEMVGLSQSAMSRLANRLEAKSCGVLKRQACEKDRRGIYTCLTEKGEKKFHECVLTFHEILQKSFAKDMFKEEVIALINHLSD